MDLMPLYELRDRLRSGVIAGAALAADDFRLKRAVEALSPLENASPVFARLAEAARAVLDPNCPDRAGALLDAITLADAILCTQGAVAVSEAVEPLETVNNGSALTNAPYSVLAPLREALTTSGGGKYSFVVDTHDQRPELFRDYRVRGALVQALGAGYVELADKAEAWLSEMGESVIPLLKNGFDPKGKKEMVRRVRVIEAIQGADADDFYLDKIPEAEKDVRAALVYALRHNEDNAEKLIELSKTEKGTAKKMAFWAMAGMENGAVWDYINQSEKIRSQAMQYMPHSTAAGAGAVVAEALDRWLTVYEADPNAPLDDKARTEIQNLLLALPGKSGEAVCDIYRRMAALGTSLDQKSYQGANGQKVTVRLRPTEDVNDRLARPFSEAVPLVLRRAILENPAPDLLYLAEELAQGGSVAFAAAAMTAALISKSPEEVYAVAKPYLKPKELFGHKKRDSGKTVLLSAMDCLRWETAKDGTMYSYHYLDPADGVLRRARRPVFGPLDRRWFKDLAERNEDGTLDDLLTRLTPLNDSELCALVGEHLYRHALNGTGPDSGRLYALRTMGWQRCDGLAVACCKAQKSMYIWSVIQVISQLPGDTESKQREGQAVCELVEKGKLQLRNGTIEQLKEAIKNLKDS